MTVIARWISILGHPFVMVAVLVSVASLRLEGGSLDAIFPVFVVVLLPLGVLMVVRVRQGRWTNVDASRVSERPFLFGAILAALAMLLIWLRLRDPESFLIRGVIVTALMVGVAAVVTRWVKISIHLAFGGFVCTILCLMGSRVGYFLIPVLPILAWSRHSLARHRPLELVLGLLLGVMAGFILGYF